MPSVILLVFMMFLGGPAAASATPSPRSARSSRAQSEILYQKGVDRYAAGRFPEALLAFEEALRRDPQSREARIAVTRVRGEMAMISAAQAAAVRVSAPRDEPVSERVELFVEFAAAEASLERIVQFVEFEDTLGDAREVAGRAEALMGRIAQLLAEKKVARAHHRRFGKDRELHALSRRLA